MLLEVVPSAPTTIDTTDTDVCLLLLVVVVILLLLLLLLREVL